MLISGLGPCQVTGPVWLNLIAVSVKSLQFLLGCRRLGFSSCPLTVCMESQRTGVGAFAFQACSCNFVCAGVLKQVISLLKSSRSALAGARSTGCRKAHGGGELVCPVAPPQGSAVSRLRADKARRMDDVGNGPKAIPRRRVLCCLPVW